MASQLEDRQQGNFSDFGITAKELSNWFIQDNLRDGTSLQSLLRYGKIEGLMKILKTDRQNGLDDNNINDMELRRKNFGDNQAFIKKHKSFLDFMYENFQDQMLRFLCYIAIANIILGLWIEGQGCIDELAILIGVLIIVLVLAGNCYVKDQKFKRMDVIIKNRNVNVKRRGKTVSINIDKLVVGDIMIIDTGEKIPVDGIVIESSDLRVDESSINGESKLIKKNIPIIYQQNEKVSPFLISGSSIIEGIGKMLVLAVGEHSQLGFAKKLMNSEQQFDSILLQEKLNTLADQIGEYGLKTAIITFLVMIFHQFYDAIFNQYPLFSLSALKDLFNSFIFSITIIIVSVPEGLTLFLTTIFAYSIFKMKDQNNLLKQYSAFEAMGSINNICCGETGIFTDNKLNVTNLFIEDKDFNINKLDLQSININTLELLCESICINSMVSQLIDDVNTSEYRIDYIEYALIEMCYKFGYDYKQIRQKMSGKIIHKLPFGEQKIKMTTILDKGDGDQYKIYTKGAPEMLLDKCSHYINEQGKVVGITNDYKQKLNTIIQNYGQQQIKSILLLFRDVFKIEEFDHLQEQIDKSYTIIGLIGLQVQLKDEIINTVQQCNQAGVIVRLISGDNIDTAIAISKKVGILPQNYEYHKDCLTVMEGDNFKQMIEGLILDEQNELKIKNVQNFQKIIKDLRVLVRSSPEDKYCLITGLKQLENVVAMIGDQINDVQSLKKADAGLTMDISGTQVVKEAASIILLDNNFTSIITSMKWGRNLFDCLRKFLIFQITINIVTVLIASLGEIFLKESPLNNIQMLWISLIMDTIASIALATEPPSNQILLTDKPFNRMDNIITPEMIKTILCQATFQIFILFIILFYGDSIFNIQSSYRYNLIIKEYNPIYQQHYTIFFNIFIFLTIFNLFNVRRYKKIELNIFQGILDNYLFLCIILITIIVQIIIIQFGGRAIKVAPLDFTQHILCILIGMFSFEVGFLIKFIPNHYFQFLKIFKQQISVEEDQETIPLISDYQKNQIKA
ncbi:unnamed protein product [Paramecium sonneborni]|uniref:Calcium-transporting ATPase n=1 Tax=Paramecium sonneborni TaxID=65129 RepID=A0A8S1MQR7_9CILI|nr:unnamed protein product [Paramecium sonneborni]